MMDEGQKRFFVGVGVGGGALVMAVTTVQLLSQRLRGQALTAGAAAKRGGVDSVTHRRARVILWLCGFFLVAKTVMVVDPMDKFWGIWFGITSESATACVLTLIVVHVYGLQLAAVSGLNSLNKAKRDVQFIGRLMAFLTIEWFVVAQASTIVAVLVDRNWVYGIGWVNYIVFSNFLLVVSTMQERKLTRVLWSAHAGLAVPAADTKAYVQRIMGPVRRVNAAGAVVDLFFILPIALYSAVERFSDFDQPRTFTYAVSRTVIIAQILMALAFVYLSWAPISVCTACPRPVRVFFNGSVDAESCCCCLGPLSARWCPIYAPGHAPSDKRRREAKRKRTRKVARSRSDKVRQQHQQGSLSQKRGTSDSMDSLVDHSGSPFTSSNGHSHSQPAHGGANGLLSPSSAAADGLPSRSVQLSSITIEEEAEHKEP